MGHAFCGFSQPAHGLSNRACQYNREKDCDTERDQKHFYNGEPFCLDDRINVAAFCGQHQDTEHCPKSLHWHRNRDDQLAAIIHPLHGGTEASKSEVHLIIDAAILTARLKIAFIIRAWRQRPQPGHGLHRPALVLRATYRRQFERNNLA